MSTTLHILVSTKAFSFPILDIWMPQLVGEECAISNKNEIGILFDWTPACLVVPIEEGRACIASKCTYGAAYKRTSPREFDIPGGSFP